jgi:hypothetical protein
VPTEQLRTVRIEPWTILVGAERLPSPHDAQPTVVSTPRGSPPSRGAPTS